MAAITPAQRKGPNAMYSPRLARPVINKAVAYMPPKIKAKKNATKIKRHPRNNPHTAISLTSPYPNPSPLNKINTSLSTIKSGSPPASIPNPASIKPGAKGSRAIICPAITQLIPNSVANISKLSGISWVSQSITETATKIKANKLRKTADRLWVNNTMPTNNKAQVISING